MTIRVACVTASAALLVLAASANAEPMFSAPFLSFDTGVAPRAVAIADLNADGRPDLVSANIGYSGLNTVSVLLGAGDGTYGPRTEFASGTGLTCDLRFCPVVPLSVAVGDLNADGRLDVAVPDPRSNTVSVLLGNGDGTLAPKTSFGTGGTPVSVVIADLNADGRPDLTVANKSSSSVSVLLGNGDGTFGSKTDFVTGSGPASIAIADLNADGQADLAVANNGGGLGNTVSVLLGNGDGSFGAKTDFYATNGVLSVAIADLNADGFLDLAVACGDLGGHDPHDPTIYPSSSVFALLGYGDGTFDGSFYALGGGLSVAVADANADGRPDLVLGGSGVSVAPGNGDGTFGSQTSLAAGGGNSVAVGDLDMDGRPDVAAAGGATVSVLLGNGNGTFGGGSIYGTGGVSLSVAAADLNGDGRLDLATSIWTSGVSVRLGNGDGTFGPGTYFPTGDAAWDVEIADLNADGRPDMAVANLYANNVSVLLGNGDGTFGPKTDYTGSSSVAIGDLNADGRPDLVTTNYSLGGFGLGSTVSVMLGNGDGTFAPRADFGTGTGPQHVAIADLNADGRPDLAVVNYAQNSGNTVSILLGNGDGTFGAKTDFAAGTGSYSVAIGDLNADGRPDLAVANYSPSALSVLLGNGDGTFGTRAVIGAGAQPVSVAIGDLNADGRPDVAVANFSSNTVSVLLGNGNGTFAPKMDFGTGGGAQSVAIADVNADTQPDLIVANRGSGTVAVLLHTGDVVTPTLLAQFDATSDPDGIRLRWSFGDASRVSSTTVERGPNAMGPWVTITTESRQLTALDRMTDPGQTYFYRLNVRLVDGSSVIFGPITSTSSALLESAVNVLSPNPARGASQIQYTVARTGHVRLDVADIAGRVVATLFDGVQHSGHFQLAWDGTSRGERLPAGIYFIRLRTVDQAVARRITRLP